MIYIFVVIYTAISAVFYHNIISDDIKHKVSFGKIRVKTIKKHIIFCVAFLPCILLSGLRYGIANDYVKIYERGFYEILNNNIVVADFELGFTWLIKVCSKIIDEPWFMFLVVSFTTIFIFVHSFEKSESFILSVILFFAQGIYFDTFNGIRQYIVIAIFLYAYRFILEDNFKKYLIIMLGASLFHISALITIPLYFLKKGKLNYFVFIVFAGSLFVFQNNIFVLFLKLMTFLPKSNSYIEKGTYSNYISTNLSGLVVSLSVLLLYLYVYRRIKNQEVGNFLINMAYLGVVFSICSTYLPLMDRFLYFTKSYYLISVPYALSLIRNKNERNVISGIFVAFILILNVYGIVSNDWYGILPYESIFSR